MFKTIHRNIEIFTIFSICLLGIGCTSALSESLDMNVITTEIPVSGQTAETDQDADQDTDQDTDAFDTPDTAIVDAAIDMMLVDMAPEIIEPEDPCINVDCGLNGRCESQQMAVECVCDNHYEAVGLSCVAEDLDQDGSDFLSDCDDDNREVYPNALELCDQIDQDCDIRVDEGACSIWVLSPRSDQWSAYPLDVSGSVNTPLGTIKAAWDIEDSDIGFVLTQNGYHELRLSALTWSPARPLSDLLLSVDAPLEHAAFADSIPASHTNSNFETITINLVDAGGTKRIWMLKYLLNSRRFERRLPDRFIGEAHIWREEHSDEYSPNPAFVRAAWTDLENDRYLLDVNPQEYCGSGPVTSNLYTALMTTDSIHLLEVGHCFDFTPSVPLAGSPLDLPNAPNFDDVGAAFWHQGSLYLFRGD